jgi:anti-anti-sigma factor
MIDSRLELDNRTLRLIFDGDVLSTNAAGLKVEAMAALASADAVWDFLEVDLSAAKMVDSVGLNLLVTIIKAVQARDRKIRIRTSNSHVRRALKFTRLDQLAEVVGA